MEGCRGQEKTLISLAPILAGTAVSGYISLLKLPFLPGDHSSSWNSRVLVIPRFW